MIKKGTYVEVEVDSIHKIMMRGYCYENSTLNEEVYIEVVGGKLVKGKINRVFTRNIPLKEKDYYEIYKLKGEK